jgi:hypothetical protein
MKNWALDSLVEFSSLTRVHALSIRPLELWTPIGTRKVATVVLSCSSLSLSQQSLTKAFLTLFWIPKKKNQKAYVPRMLKVTISLVSNVTLQFSLALDNPPPSTALDCFHSTLETAICNPHFLRMGLYYKVTFSFICKLQCHQIPTYSDWQNTKHSTFTWKLPLWYNQTPKYYSDNRFSLDSFTLRMKERPAQWLIPVVSVIQEADIGRTSWRPSKEKS